MFCAISACVSIILIGCSGKIYPQYTGTYTLVEPAQIDLHQGPNSKFELPLAMAIMKIRKLPSKIQIAHQVKFKFSSFFHTISIDPNPSQMPLSTSYSSPITVDLKDVTRRSGNTIESVEKDGLQIYSEEVKTKGLNPGCSAQYVWNFFIKTQENSPELLDQIYLGNKIEDTANGPIATQISAQDEQDPPIDAEATQIWMNNISKNNGIDLVLELRLDVSGSFSGCSTMDADMPQVDHLFGTIRAKYHANPEDLILDSNPATQTLVQGDSGLAFWKQVVGPVY